MEVGAYSISFCFKNCEDNFVWIFSGVYGPVQNEERENFWTELSDIRGLWHDPWCVGRDFNVVRFPGERRDCLRGSTTTSYLILN